ncbi:MAG: hypothetical protein ACUVSM_11720, partial [Armatimonadota bacterium]
MAFRREKYVPRGGPAGGDGGCGGDVVLQADDSLNTLVDLRYQTRYRAADGGRGGPNNRSGANQPPLIIRVPVGTSVYCLEKDRYIADLTYSGQTVVVARGGRGGPGSGQFGQPAFSLLPGGGHFGIADFAVAGDRLGQLQHLQGAGVTRRVAGPLGETRHDAGVPLAELFFGPVPLGEDAAQPLHALDQVQHPVAGLHVPSD